MADCDVSPAIVVHGGAGHFPDHRVDPAIAGCRRAVEVGLEQLHAGASALDAVQAAVRCLEDEPTFNAGVGSVLTRAGTVELDAAVMDGRDRRFGAIAAVPNVRRAIDAARAVMEDGEHVLLGGEAAWVRLRELGFEPCDPSELIVDRARERWRLAKQKDEGAEADWDPGTVGACAIDRDGHVAVATSTGGINYKRVGRIGDTPLCGCGTYADDRGAASATGNGEAIIRVTMSRVCIDAIRAGCTASEAAWMSVAELGGVDAGKGGIVCCDRDGRLGAAHNSPRMAWGAGRGEAVIADIRIDAAVDIDELLR